MDVTLNRTRLQEVHEVLRHLADRRSSSPLSDKVLVRAEPGRVSMVATNGDVDVFHQTPAPESTVAAQFIVPAAALAELAKGKDGPVQLAGETAAQADIEKFPVIGADGPKRFRHADWPVLNRHFLNAAEVAAAGPDRYAINNICLTQSSIIATDGRQLYAGNSLSLPIRKGQDWLASPAKVLTSKAFGNFTQVAMARDDNGILFKFGDAWTVRLRQQEGRFPSWEKFVPKAEEAKATLAVPDEKSKEFIGRLSSLTEGCGKDAALRLTLGPKVVLAMLDKELKEIRSMEILDLPRTGENLAITFDPKFLVRALEMGFATFLFFAANKPIVARKASDIYLWMPICEEDAAPASAEQSPAAQKENPPTRKRKTKAAKPESPRGDLNSSVLAELDSIKDTFRDLTHRVSTVQQSIRQKAGDLQKREKAVRHALAGLKQLKNLGA